MNKAATCRDVLYDPLLLLPEPQTGLVVSSFRRRSSAWSKSEEMLWSAPMSLRSFLTGQHT